MKKRLLRIVAPYFVAGVILDHKWKAMAVAPIIRYMLKSVKGPWSLSEIEACCHAKGWDVHCVDVWEE
jgi:hypothetical protein